MAIKRRLPWPELLFLFVGVWLCLTLEPNAAARLPSDGIVFPSEPQPKLESRLKEMEREMAEVSRLTNVTLLMMEQEAKKNTTKTRISTGIEKPPETTTGRGEAEMTNPAEEQINTTTPRNQTHPASESKLITFASDPESNSQQPWEETEIPTTIKTKVDLGPRITLETTRICTEGFTLSNNHCRKNA